MFLILAREVNIIAKCTLCGERIGIGDTAYRPNGVLMCSRCVAEAEFVFRGSEDGAGDGDANAPDGFDPHFYFGAAFECTPSALTSSGKPKRFTVYRKDGSVGQNKVTRAGG